MPGCVVIALSSGAFRIIVCLEFSPSDAEVGGSPRLIKSISALNDLSSLPKYFFKCKPKSKK